MKTQKIKKLKFILIVIKYTFIIFYFIGLYYIIYNNKAVNLSKNNFFS